ncbi:MAG TPA: D-alanine--D-alanine ligase family protein [Bellilinea sp.]|nr:D-alanine--D-alanine ligase family protein [Bellilinea sp.]
MTNKKKVGVIFGGRSGEHEVSLQSARSVLANLDPEKYEVTQIGITHDGRWFSGENVLEAFEKGTFKNLIPVILPAEPGHNGIYSTANGQFTRYADLDVVFPVLHGTFGEDGTMQGLLELSGLAYVGAGVLGSSLGMDKGLFKQVMRANDIPVLESIIFQREDLSADMGEVIAAVERISPYPLFTKPANLGSSVGITKCRSRSDLYEGLLDAARYDRRVLVERGLESPREIEVSVLGNEKPVAAVPGEIVPGEDFYSYSAKYQSERSHPVIPADLPAETLEKIQAMAVKIYQAIDCAGMARVDFLIDRNSDAIFVSEVNTIPGFTQISMYAKMWTAAGLPYPQLVDRLIELAFERKAQRDQTEYTYKRGA